jgi:hypothetical protein
MSKKALLAAVLGALVVAAVSASSAFAGEVKGPPGNTDPTPIGAAPDEDPHASSICSFSGQNDGELPLGRTAEHVQSWGQIPKEERDFLSTVGAHPGDSCNGNTGFFAGG